MIPAGPQPSREDILYAFAVESDPGRDTLERYLGNYPQYAAELIELSYELSREVCEEETLLSDEDLALIDQSWQRHTDTAPKEFLDPLSTLSVAEQRELSQRLDVPRQVITAFREHRVDLASVPLLFLERLAAAMNSTTEILRNVLAFPHDLGLARSYKANARPEPSTSITFEQLLIEADVPPEKRALLLTDKN